MELHLFPVGVSMMDKNKLAGVIKPMFSSCLDLKPRYIFTEKYNKFFLAPTVSSEDFHEFKEFVDHVLEVILVDGFFIPYPADLKILDDVNAEVLVDIRFSNFVKGADTVNKFNTELYQLINTSKCKLIFVAEGHPAFPHTTISNKLAEFADKVTIHTLEWKSDVVKNRNR